MPKEIFIHEWKIQDYAGRREPTMKSELTIILKDRDAYQKRLEDFAQAEHERELK